MDLVTEKQVDQALHFLAESDAEVANARVMVMRSEYMADVAEALAYKIGSGSVRDREMAAKVSPEVRKAMEAVFEATEAYEMVKARRKRAELTIEVWRSWNASKRVGNV